MSLFIKDILQYITFLQFKEEATFLLYETINPLLFTPSRVITLILLSCKTTTDQSKSDLFWTQIFTNSNLEINTNPYFMIASGNECQ